VWQWFIITSLLVAEERIRSKGSLCSMVSPFPQIDIIGGMKLIVWRVRGKIIRFVLYYAKRLARKNVSEMTYFVSSGT